MVVDYEDAWARLGELVASKTQHGREGLLTEMQRIAAECRVPAGELSRLLRLYGVEVERIRAENDRDEPPASDADSLGAGTARSPATMTPLGGAHDGSRNADEARGPATARA